MQQTIVYGFEVMSIQRYILQGGKLKDMVGASEQVNDLCDGFLMVVCRDLDLKEDRDVFIARKAGGALTLFFEEEKKARDFRDLWTLRVQIEMPGLAFTQALVRHRGSAADAVAQLQLRLGAERNRALPVLPLTSPLARRYERTGVVSAAERHKEFPDASTLAKWECSKTTLTDRFQPKSGEPKLYWPKVLVNKENAKEEERDDRPLIEDGEAGYVAIIHADGNGLGEILAGLKEAMPTDARSYAAKWLAFSTALEKATEAALYEAMAPWRKGAKHTEKGAVIMPARPLILGGDDVTLIVRAELALDFAEDFLTKFERASAKEFDDIRDQFGDLLPEMLTACAGIALVKPKQSFHQAYELCESLCTAAKVASKQERLRKQKDLIPASLAFHRVTTSSIDTWETILDKELTAHDGVCLTMQPYALEPGTGMPVLRDLKCLHGALKETSRGATRELARLLRSGGGQAMQALHRWQENMQKDQQDKAQTNRSTGKDLQEDVLTNLKISFEILTEGGHQDLEGLLPIYDADRRSPLGDALALRAIGGKNDTNSL